MRVSLIGAICVALLCGHAAAQSGGATASDALAGQWQGGPAGLYFVQTYDSTGMDRRTYLFVGDRWAESPQGDLTRFDFDAADPARSGRWSVAGDEMILTPASGQPRQGKFVLNPDTCFDFRDGIWCPAKPFASTALDGAYSGGSSYASSGGAASVAADYLFSPDGTFRRLAAGSFQDADTPGDGVTAAGETAGRYRIEGLTLVLTEQDGSERRDIAFPFGEGAEPAKPDYIYFGGWLLKRQS